MDKYGVNNDPLFSRTQFINTEDVNIWVQGRSWFLMILVYFTKIELKSLKLYVNNIDIIIHVNIISYILNYLVGMES